MKYPRKILLLATLSILSAAASYRRLQNASSSYPLRDAITLESAGGPSDVIKNAKQTGGSLDSPTPARPSKAAPKVLVILSSENKITLKDGAMHPIHPTGFFLSELMVPLKKLIDAGYEPVFANPKGNKAVMDKISDQTLWFGDAPDAAPQVKAAAQRKYQDAKSGCKQMGICGEGPEGALALKSLSQAVAEGLDQYAGVFLPGGHAPMEDLWKDKSLGAILRHFHDAGKPTALICHAPIALLSTMSRPEEYVAALEKKDPAAAAKAKDWIYKGYSLTIFTTAEEKQEEPGQDNALGGFVRFYPDEALETAGAGVRRAMKWNSNAVRDRELITGQNPMSDEAFAEQFLAALNAQGAGK